MSPASHSHPRPENSIVITMKRAGLRSAGLRLGALTACALLSGCPDPVEMSAQVNTLTVQPNPVPAPTANAPSEFTVQWQANTSGKAYGYTFYLLAPQAASAAQDQDKVVIDFGECSTGCDPAALQHLQCTSSLSTARPSERVVTCADPTQNQRPVTLPAGRYTSGLVVYEDPNVIYHDRTFEAKTELPLSLE